MKLTCDIIQDLLPLYEDGLCSPGSRAAVEEHLLECPSCRALADGARDLPPVEEPETPHADRAVAKSIQKVKRKWLLSLAAVLLVVPVLLLSVNQFRGRGVCFTNLDELVLAWRYVRALETQDWETAAGLHDYSDSYDSIQEALSMPVESWGASFTPIPLGNESWVIASRLDCNALEGDPAQALFGYLYNRVGTAMIPAALWAQVIAVDPGAVEQEGFQYWLNGEYYAQVATPWGEFVVSEGLRYDSAYDYCTRIDLLPMEIWAEAKADLDAEARQVYDSTHAAYDHVADMTAAEFDVYMTETFAADLQKLTDMGCTIDSSGYQSAYRAPESGNWHVTWKVTISMDGKAEDCYFDLTIADGAVRYTGLSHREQTDWLDGISQLLYPSAHPDY